MRLIALAAASLALPGLAHAEAAGTESGVTVTGSLTFATAYVSDGIEYSDGPVIQPYLELGYGGFYAGIWASNAEEDLLGADSEIDFYIGYRGEAGAFYYDVGYGYYTYPGASEFNSGEVLVSGGAGLSETLFVTGYLGYADETSILDLSVRVDYYTPVEGLALAATFGDRDGSDADFIPAWQYWSIGGSYALTDTVSADLTWHETDLVDTDGLFVGGLTISF
jgi:uncharacterized protein (TIGR02001 family)